MFCDKCGKQIPDDSDFCSECGAPLIYVPQESYINYKHGEHNAEKKTFGNNTIVRQVTSGASSKAFGQFIKEFFFKNGKINILGWSCVLVPLFVIALIFMIKAGNDSANEKNRLSKSVAENKTAMELETEDKKSDVSIQDTNAFVSNELSHDSSNEGGLPEDVYEEIKGTYYSEVNFIVYKITERDEIICDWGAEFETSKIVKYEEVDDSWLLYVDSGSIVQSWKDEKGNYYLSLLEGGGWDYEKTHVYSILRRISNNTSLTFEDIIISSEDEYSSNSIKKSEDWYGERLAEGDPYEGGIPEETYSQIKGKYSDSYRVAEIISPNQIKFGYLNDGLIVFDIYGCDVKSQTLYIYATADNYQYMFSVKREDNNFVLKFCTGHWNSNQFAPEATLLRIDNETRKDYIIPDSSTRLLTENDLIGLSNDDLRKARNEILARHGRKFKDTELQSYFNSQLWYNGVIEPDDFNSVVRLSDVEQKNIDFIKQHEK